MLHELRVRDFALIDRLTVGFGHGLNAITGETGSGKSLIVTALELLGGARPRGGVGIWVRSGAERAVLEASFDVPRPTSRAHAAVSAWFERHLPELAGDCWGEDGELLVVRVLDGGGRSRARVQGLSVTVGALGELVRELLEVNGQFEQRAVNEPSRQTAWFDEIVDGPAAVAHAAVAESAVAQAVVHGQLVHGQSVLGKSVNGQSVGAAAENGRSKEAARTGAGVGQIVRIPAALSAYSAVREHWISCRAERLAIEERARERDGRATFLRIALEELEALEPRGGEGSELRRERELLRQSEQVVGDLGATAGALSEGDDPLITQVAVVADRVARWASAAEPLHQVAESLSTGLVHLEDAAARLVSFLGGVESDPQRLEQVEVRLAALERAARRHGVDVDRLAVHVEALRSEADELDDLDGARERTQREERLALDGVVEAAGILSDRRRARAGALAVAVQPLLDRLGLAQARLDVCFTERGACSGVEADGESDGDLVRRFGPVGAEDATLFWSPNPGEPARPLAHIASGGEAARVFLALRCAATGAALEDVKPAALRPRKNGQRASKPGESPAVSGTADEPRPAAGFERAHTLVFDEVDAAVGGRLAPKVAECLAALARGGQVLTVTHQPAIAARADRHLAVVKRTRGGRTAARAVMLEGTARLSEIAAMVGGSGRSATARAEAERLLACGGVRRGQTRSEEARSDGAGRGEAGGGEAGRSEAGRSEAARGEAGTGEARSAEPRTCGARTGGSRSVGARREASSDSEPTLAPARSRIPATRASATRASAARASAARVSTARVSTTRASAAPTSAAPTSDAKNTPRRSPRKSA